ncbi:DUF3526 domain-containing protein [Tenacibaculum agarivorans]|uniref:DUF3526 domain-containing protein n=1 Tax=Tenacibaculum agarivorans TaxID=1908389 RepID=UPI00094BB6AF|nr:DUF3526 domain-containing protein [Tenacibaculum agarivorans]
MYALLITQFLRSKTVILAFGIVLVLGVLSISTGKQFLNQKQVAVEKTIAHQKKHLETQLSFHKDDIGLLSYYIKFSFINPVRPLAGISIGQSDVNSHIQSVGIVALEGQKHNTDLVNPMRLQVGNLDFSFLIIFLFPLVIIALTFNLLSEEEEIGTWKMITIHAKSTFRFLLLKLSMRLLFVFGVMILLFLAAKIILDIPFTGDFMAMCILSSCYILFWFALCLFVVFLRKSSNTNAIVLLASWLVLVVFLPVLVNNYITNSYPIGEAYTMAIKQRDAYHEKWDTDKIATYEKFYAHYPHLRKYGMETEGFNWVWYYAMQQLGDDDSKEEREAMYAKIKKRELLSRKIARFFPPLKVQLSMNDIAKTSLTQHVDFLDATTKFHEKIRLDLYPKVFEKQDPSSIAWEKYQPEFFKPTNEFSLGKSIVPMLLIVVLLVGFSVFRNLKYFS